MDSLAFVLSVLVTVCVCIPQLLKGKNMKMILLLVFFSNALMATSYILTGAFNGAVSCCVGAVQTIINYFFERKNKALPVWLISIYAIAFTVVNVFAFTQITDILALVASLAFVMGISQKNGKQYRVWSLVNTVLWIAYDLINRSYGPLSTHGILLIMILWGIIMHDRTKKKA